MTRLVRLTAVLALLAPLCLAAGCKQGVGDRCQVTSDCDDGLMCVLPPSGTAQAGGICQGNNAAGDDLSVTAGPDISSPADMTPRATDMMPSTD